MFARVLIAWLIAGQAICLCLPYFKSRPPSQLEIEAVHNQSPAIQMALEKELDRVADYETKRAIGIITLLLAVDGVIIGCFWNYGVKRTDEKIAVVEEGKA